ncbi:MAG: response regulator, partial [Blautia sp.]|nr:response regulator [Blautia sp.]
MMRIMIVDDDYQIREGIRRAVNWEELGFDRVETYEDGIYAYEAMSNVKPDLILCDIEMPIMSGLQFAQKLRENGNRTRIIFLTAFSDFEYCQKALRLGADDYILKPVKLHLLKESIRINVEKLKLSYKQELLYEEAVLEDLLGKICYEGHADLTLSFIQEFQNKYPEIPSSFLIVMVLHRKQEFEEADEKQIAEKLYERNAVLLNGRNGEKICIGGTGNSRLYSMHDRIRLQRLIESYNSSQTDSRFWLAAGISEACEAGKLAEGFRKAVHTANLEFYTGKQVHLEEELLCIEKGRKNPETFRDIRRKIADAAEAMDRARIERFLFEWKDAALTAHMSPEQFRREYMHIYQKVIRRLELTGEEDLFEIDLKNCVNAIECQECLLDYLSVIKEYSIVPVPKGEKNSLMAEAAEYMKSHYQEALSAAEVAEHIGKSSGYFSSLMKKEMGVGFPQYLAMLRMERACHLLLHSRLKVNEIAQEVGYTDYLYF